MIAREVASVIIIAVMATILSLQALEKLQERQEEKEMRVCIEYFDSEGNRIKECDLK